MNKERLVDIIKQSGIVAIMRNISKDHLKLTVEALYRGGILCIEVTANTKDAIWMVNYMAEHYENKIVAGVGTILNENQAVDFIKAGAKMLISPHTNGKIIDIANQNGIVSIPGAYTATEIINAHQWGADLIKLFPAVSGGVEHIKQLKGPIPEIPLLAVGGINVNNATDYIASGCIGIGVGANLVNLEVISRGDYDWIENEAKKYISCIAIGREKMR